MSSQDIIMEQCISFKGTFSLTKYQGHSEWLFRIVMSKIFGREIMRKIVLLCSDGDYQE